MNDTWDLSILYKGFDDPAFTGDMAALDAAIRSMNDLAAQAAALPHADLVHRYVDNQLQLTTLISKLFIFCSLRTSANTGRQPGQQPERPDQRQDQRLRRRRRLPAPHPGRLRRPGRHHRRRPRPGGIPLSAAEHPPGQQVPPVRQGGGAVRPDEHLRRFRLGEPAG